uniref:Metalloendopeptidase n=1 Tax=Conus geographus TaxID=6491 RepID=W4VS62_CONGE
MTKTSPSVLAVFLLLSLCFMQRIGAVPVGPVMLEEEQQGENEVRQPHADKTIDEIIVDAYGGLEAEEAVEEFRMMVEGVETEGMDTLLTPEQAAILHNAAEGGMSKRRLATFITPWAGRVVPYDISGLPAEHHDMMMEAFREWEMDTCVRFVSAQPQHQHRIFFSDGNGCSSFLGMTRWSEQPVTLGSACHTKAVYLHELGHALGLVHEHRLPQRDRYITVDFGNVNPRFVDQFYKYSASEIPDAEQVTYNLRSIMHYGKHAFSKDRRLQTIYAKDKSQEDLMGTSEELTTSDIEVINLLYNCNGWK